MSPLSHAAGFSCERTARALLSIALLCLLAACSFLRGYAEGRSEAMLHYESQDLSPAVRGGARLAFDDFGGLNTDTLESNALPWKITSTALVLARYPNSPPTQEDLRGILMEFGFLFPERIDNWPLEQQPRFEKPLGIVSGMIRRGLPKIELEASNTGCAACHAGVTYSADGMPTHRAWLGLPNTSMNVDGFGMAVYQALKIARRNREALFVGLVQLYPDTSEAEKRTIRRFVWPRVVRRVDALERSGDRPIPFENGGPGVTNGVAALKMQLGVLAPDTPSVAFVSIPDLGQRRFRSSLLADGVYTNSGATRFLARTSSSRLDPVELAGIVFFFTVPTMGVHPERAPAAIPRVAEAMQFLGTYAPPDFPGIVDDERAGRGSSLYKAHCSNCHGNYEDAGGHPALVSFPNRLVRQAESGTDSSRWEAIDDSLLHAIFSTVISTRIDAQRTEGYVAPLLSGLWATAPYLHNGSVPTIWHLMHPEARPAHFWAGGHALDFTRLGIAGAPDQQGVWAYPPAYSPWSTPVVVDTAAPGRSNKGHESEFISLSEDDKTDLIEYLKLL